MKKIADCIIREVHQLQHHDFKMVVETQSLTMPVQAGQFAQILVEGSPTTYLRRPISICDVDYEKGIIVFYIRKVGAGTIALSQLREGETINIIYPLGKGFTTDGVQNPLLIGGGCGIAPLLLLAKEFKAKNIHPVLLAGGQTKNALTWIQDIDNTIDVHYSTDDGTYGEMGLVTKHSLLENVRKFDKIYTCGPEPMMKAVALLAGKMQIACEVSLENTMACGIGACLCCVAPTTEGNICVCTEGPVFESKLLKNFI